MFFHKQIGLITPIPRTGVRWLVTAFAALATCRQSRAASSGPDELDAVPHSTATSRLSKARTSPRTPKWSRLRRAGRNAGSPPTVAMPMAVRRLECAVPKPCSLVPSSLLRQRTDLTSGVPRAIRDDQHWISAGLDQRHCPTARRRIHVSGRANARISIFLELHFRARRIRTGDKRTTAWTIT
jgi:hypothetical protein